MQLTIKGTFQIETENGFAINPRIIVLLKEIDQSGSLNAAVQKIGMSYSYAWNLLNKPGCQMNKPLFISKKAGNGGGIAQLTPAGKQLIKHCKQLEYDFEKFFEKHSIII